MGKEKRKTLATPASTLTGDLLNDLQAAQILGVLPRTLRLWRSTRGLPHIKLTAKIIRYRRSDLDAWLNSHRVAIAA